MRNVKKIVNQNSLKQSVVFPILMLVAMWTVYGFEHYLHTYFTSYGIYPRDLVGIRGILFSPFIHGDLEHIVNNSYPVLFLGTAIFYFYKNTAKFVMMYSFLMTGIWVWAMARASFHIGASGLIYAWGAFLFTSGVLNKNKQMLGVSLLIVFLYGSMVWGVLPLVEGVSFESHLFGALAGIILAFVFKKDGPQRKSYQWESDEEEYEIEFWNMTPDEINEYYKNKQKEKTLAQRTKVSIKYNYKTREES
jgi:membrane associated rhomboid family serine protease